MSSSRSKIRERYQKHKTELRMEARARYWTKKQFYHWYCHDCKKQLGGAIIARAHKRLMRHIVTKVCSRNQ